MADSRGGDSRSVPHGLPLRPAPPPLAGGASGGLSIKGAAGGISIPLRIQGKGAAGAAERGGDAGRPRPRALDLGQGLERGERGEQGHGHGQGRTSSPPYTARTGTTATNSSATLPDTPLEEGEVRIPKPPRERESVRERERPPQSETKKSSASAPMDLPSKRRNSPDEQRDEQLAQVKHRPQSRSRSRSRSSRSPASPSTAGPSRPKTSHSTADKSADRPAETSRRRESISSRRGRATAVDELISGRRPRDDEERSHRARNERDEYAHEDAYGRKRRRSVSADHSRRDKETSREADRRKRPREDRSPPVPPSRRRYDDEYRHARAYDQRDDVLDYEAGGGGGGREREREQDRRDDRSYRPRDNDRDWDRDHDRDRDRDRYGRREYGYRESQRRVYDNDDDRYARRDPRDARDRDSYRYARDSGVDGDAPRAHGYDLPPRPERVSGDHWNAGGSRRAPDARYAGHPIERVARTRSPEANGYAHPSRNPYARRPRPSRARRPRRHPTPRRLQGRPPCRPTPPRRLLDRHPRPENRRRQRTASTSPTASPSRPRRTLTLASPICRRPSPPHRPARARRPRADQRRMERASCGASYGTSIRRARKRCMDGRLRASARCRDTSGPRRRRRWAKGLLGGPDAVIVQGYPLIVTRQPGHGRHAHRGRKKGRPQASAGTRRRQEQSAPRGASGEPSTNRRILTAGALRS